LDNKLKDELILQSHKKKKKMGPNSKNNSTKPNIFVLLSVTLTLGFSCTRKIPLQTKSSTTWIQLVLTGMIEWW